MMTSTMTSTITLSTSSPYIQYRNINQNAAYSSITGSSGIVMTTVTTSAMNNSCTWTIPWDIILPNHAGLFCEVRAKLKTKSSVNSNSQTVSYTPSTINANANASSSTLVSTTISSMATTQVVGLSGSDLQTNMATSIQQVVTATSGSQNNLPVTSFFSVSPLATQTAILANPNINANTSNYLLGNTSILFGSIVTNGLIGYLDTMNASSYSAAVPNTWYDLVQRIPFTLYGNPTYVSDKNGYLLFSSSSYAEMAVFNFQLANWTFDCWTLTSSSNSVAQTQLMSSVPYNNGANNLNFAIGNYSSNKSSVEAFFIQNGTVCESPSSTLSNGQWMNVAGSYVNANSISLYINGTLVGTTDLTSVSGIGAQFNLTGMRLMHALNSQQGRGGGLAIARMYNRTLSASEIQQNYNAEKARFITNTPPIIIAT